MNGIHICSKQQTVETTLNVGIFDIKHKSYVVKEAFHLKPFLGGQFSNETTLQNLKILENNLS